MKNMGISTINEIFPGRAVIFLRWDIFWITDKRVGQGIGQGANGGLTRSLIRASADARFSKIEKYENTENQSLLLAVHVLKILTIRELPRSSYLVIFWFWVAMMWASWWKVLFTSIQLNCNLQLDPIRSSGGRCHRERTSGTRAVTVDYLAVQWWEEDKRTTWQKKHFEYMLSMYLCTGYNYALPWAQ